MKKLKIHILALTIANLLTINAANALNEIPATPSILSEPDSKLLITEINFKNKQQDFAVITYLSPSNKPTNLKNITIKDDGTVTKIEQEFHIASGQQILLTWNSDQPNTAPYLYSTKKGLTGTTEQLIIYDQNNEILDMVCWTNDSPTETEIKDFTEAHEQGGWANNNIESCIPSEQIQTNESIKRIGTTDTNSINDWNLPEPEPEPEPEPQIPLTEIETPSTTTTEQEPDLITIEIPEPEIATTTETTAKTKTYTNGTLSTDIIISEILPNPEGSDSGKEWIELHNQGTQTINLGNWILDDNEEGSKPYTLPDTLTIKANQTTLIDTKAIKLSLGNKEDSVRLFDHTNQLITEVEYEDAPSNESYSLIAIIDEDEEITSEYNWTANQSPGQPNPIYHSYTVTIETEPKFEDQYFFEATTQDSQPLNITFTEETIAAPLAKATFTKGTKLKITVEKTNDTLNLIDYKTIGSPDINTSPSGILLPIFLGFLAAAGITIYIVTKKIHWQVDKKTI